MSTSPRFVKRLNAIPVKSPVDVSMEIDAAAAAASLQSCPTLCHPIDHQASLSLGFSRQEHWSGLPFPSPMCESEKWKGSRSVMSQSSRSHELQPTGLLRPWDFPGKSTGVGCHRLLRMLHLGNPNLLRKLSSVVHFINGIFSVYVQYSTEVL